MPPALCSALAALAALGQLTPAPQAVGQDGPRPTRVFAGYIGGGIDVRWAPPREAPNRGYNIYRSGRLLTEKPIKRMTSVSEIREVLGETALRPLLELLRAPDGVEQLDNGLLERALEWDGVGGLLTLLTLSSPAMATVMGERFLDKDVPDGARVTYRVTYIREDRKEAELGTAEVIARAKRPPAPRAVRVASVLGVTHLDWEIDQRLMARDAIASYRVMRARRQGGPFLTLGDGPVFASAQATTGPPGPAFIDTDVVSGEAYYYQVVAVDVFDRPSEPSQVVRVTLVDDVPPVAPVLESVAVKAGAVTLAFRPIGADAPVSYLVERGATPRGPWIALRGGCGETAESRECSDTPQPGTHFYRVSARDSAGNLSAASEPIPAHVDDAVAPGAPGRVDAKADRRSPGRVTVTWAAPKDKDLDYYEVLERHGGPAAPPLVVATVPVRGKRKVVLEGRTSMYQAYLYSVRAIDDSGNFGPEAAAKSPVVATMAAPSAPVVTGLTATADGAALTWVCAQIPKAVGFEVQVPGKGKRFKTIAELGPGTMRYVDGAASVGAAVAYRVLAIGERGEETASEVVSLEAFSPPEVVAAPSGLAAKAGRGGVALKWKGSAPMGFRVYRGVAGEPAAYLEATTGTSYADASADPEVRYGYYVVGVDSRGDETAPTEVVEVGPPAKPAPEPPAAPAPEPTPTEDTE